MTHEMGQISLDDILITDELFRRSPRTPDLKAENNALRTLARQLAEQPQTMLRTLVTFAKDLCWAGTAGVSLLETMPNGETVFRWVAIAGELANYEQGSMQCDFSPCGICLERQSPQLYSNPARYFTALQSVEPAVVESLVIPLIAADQPLGAIWIVSHDPQRQFDVEDVRIMTSLADFTAAALQNKQIEESLRQREAELSLVTNSVPVLISFVDAQQRYRFNNKTYEEWFGHAAADIYGKPLWEVVGDTAYQTLRPYVEQVLAGQQVTFESEISYRDGRTRHIQATYIPRFDAQGTVEGFVALVRDISEAHRIANERNQAETSLREAEQRLRLANERFELAATAVNCLIYEWDIQQNRVERTQGITQMLGYSLEETEPHPEWWGALIHPDDLQQAIDEIDRALAKGDRHVVEYRVRNKDNQYIYVLDHGIVVQRDANGNPSRRIGCTVNINDRKQAEIALQKSESLLNAFLISSPVAMAFLDADLRYLYANEALAEVNGLPLSEHLGRTLWEVLPEWAPQFAPIFEQVMRTREPILNQEVSGETNPPGVIRHSLVSYYPVCLPTGEVLGVGVSGLRITEIKEAEAALRQSEERLRIAQRAAKAGVWDWNISTNQVSWSEEYYQLYGLDPATVQPSYANWLASIIEQDRDRVDCMTRATLEHQTNLNVEFRILHPTQGERWITAIGQTFYDANQQPIRMTGIALDITDRKQAEAELRESEARFRHMTDTAPVLVWMAGTDKLCNYLNRPWLDFTGRTIEQEISNGWTEGIHPDDVQHCLETYFAAFDARQPFQVEYRRRRFDGVYRWMVDAGVPRFTSDGDFLGYIGSCIDIEERKQAEEALAQSEAQLRLIIESARDYAIFTLNMEGYITRWNSGAQRLLGYSESEILGQDGRIIFTPEDIERGENEREEHNALTTGRAENERWHVRKDGSHFWASGLMMPLRDEDNQIQGFLKIMQDKTAQRQADERLHLLYETTSDLLAAEHPMMLINKVFSKLSMHLELDYYYNFMVEEKDSQRMLHLRNYGGISEEAAQALEWVELGQLLCGVVAQERRPLVLNQEQIAIHPNAHLICLMGVSAYAGYPLMARGRLLGTLSFASLKRSHFTPEEIDLLQSVCEQISIAIERANLTASIQQQAEQLQQANRIKDEFLAVLSHELRSPLNPILGWSKLLQTGRLDEAKSKQAIVTIERNAKLQAELIEDLLDVSRILQGKLSLNMAPVNLASTIQAAMETVRLAAEAKTIDLRFEMGSAPEPSSNGAGSKSLFPSTPSTIQVLGDAARIQQVMWNLLSNAVKFTPAGGRVEVRLEAVMSNQALPMGNVSQSASLTDAPSPMTRSSLPTHYAQITVRDTGKGISPNFLPHVFDYFRQADSATTRKFGGLGLGLAIVHHLVELHGGTIQAESQGEGMGATFTVKLPLLRREGAEAGEGQAQEPSNAASAQPLLDLQILVADDDTDTREFLVFLLEQAGATVTAVASASEAFALLTRFKPDLLLSDIGMPDMDGYMLLRQIRKLPPEQGGSIPAIALTAYAGEINYQQAIAAGFQRHLSKPIEPEELIRVIMALGATHNQRPRRTE